jgi:hypothetical protein
MIGNLVVKAVTSRRAETGDLYAATCTASMAGQRPLPTSEHCYYAYLSTSRLDYQWLSRPVWSAKISPAG